MASLRTRLPLHQWRRSKIVGGLFRLGTVSTRHDMGTFWQGRSRPRRIKAVFGQCLGDQSGVLKHGKFSLTIPHFSSGYQIPNSIGPRTQHIGFGRRSWLYPTSVYPSTDSASLPLLFSVSIA